MDGREGARQPPTRWRGPPRAAAPTNGDCMGVKLQWCEWGVDVVWMWCVCCGVDVEWMGYEWGVDGVEMGCGWGVNGHAVAVV